MLLNWCSIWKKEKVVCIFILIGMIPSVQFSKNSPQLLRLQVLIFLFNFYFICVIWLCKPGTTIQCVNSNSYPSYGLLRHPIPNSGCARSHFFIVANITNLLSWKVIVAMGDWGSLFWCTNFWWESPAILSTICWVLQFVPVHVSLRYL
jgi:hypothetical protein